ncbi:hypothetical protein K474DRAFT_1665003 [Panus rudis PR-1116 ss-1]|nr:hypothetical protein K474DRAFT_1665003 [Panus rudis PR-1116 ss-1]
MHRKLSQSIVGPLPTPHFFESFVNPGAPGILSKLKRVLKKTFSRITTRSTPQDIQSQLMDAVSTRGFCSNYVLKSDGYSQDVISEKLRPSLCLYSRDDEPLEGSPDWINLEIMVDIHSDESADPFPSPSNVSQNHSCPINKSAGQLVLDNLERYLTALFARQHRTSTLALCIFGRFVRFLYVDHAGAVASEAVNYVANPRILAEFFWRYNHLSRIERGFDPTVIPATQAERRRLTQAVTHYLQSVGSTDRVNPKIRNTLAKDYPTYKVEMVSESSSTKTEYIIRKPCAESRHALGRATRGFVALQVSEGASDESPDVLVQRLVFLKDYWRVPSSQVQKESESYKELEEHDVPHIPSVVSAGDVYTGSRVQRSQTQRVLRMKNIQLVDPPTSLPQHIHHRVVQQLGLPLSSVRNARELVQVMRDALEALIDGYTNARLLHRDISDNNILISPIERPDGLRRGLLNDWDITCKVPPGCTTILPRSGTWRFMSCYLLHERHVSHQIYDDLQSIFWVLLYTSARHFRHSGYFWLDLFDEERHFQFNDGTEFTKGGSSKLGYFDIDEQCPVFRCRALNDLFTKLRALWRDYHDSLRSRKPHDETRLQQISSRLLKIFDMTLHRRCADDWVGGDWVPDLYAEWDAGQKEETIVTPTLNSNNQMNVGMSIDDNRREVKEEKRLEHANMERPSSDTLISSPNHTTPFIRRGCKRARGDLGDASVPACPPKAKRYRHSPEIVLPIRRSQRLIDRRGL